MGQIAELTGPDLERAGQAIRDFLKSHWQAMQEAWVDCGSQPYVPDALSTDTCRPTSLFARQVLAEAGFGNWTVLHGIFRWADIDCVPSAITDPYDTGEIDTEMEWAAHSWLVSEDGKIYLDITADQFGYPPVAAMLAGSIKEYLPLIEQDDIFEDANATSRVRRWLGLPEEEILTPDSTARGAAAELVQALRAIHTEMLTRRAAAAPAP